MNHKCIHLHEVWFAFSGKSGTNRHILNFLFASSHRVLGGHHSTRRLIRDAARRLFVRVQRNGECLCSENLTKEDHDTAKGCYRYNDEYQAAALAASLLNHKKRSSGYRQKLIQSKVHSLENMSKKLGTLLDCAMQEENHGILQLIIYTPPFCYGKNNPKTQDLYQLSSRTTSKLSSEPPSVC